MQEQKITPIGKCRSLLFEELSNRRKRNPVYSLRAFARDLGVSTTALSDVLAQKRRFSRKNAMKVAEKLSLRPSATKELLGELERPGSRAEKSSEPIRQYQLLDEDSFSLISDWYYLAILNLATLHVNRGDAEWVADRLNIHVLDARCALDRLSRMGLLQITGGRMRRTTLPTMTTKDVPSAAIRKFHRQLLRMAEHSLDHDPLDLRMFAAVTVGTNVEKMQEAKRLIRDTRDRIAKLLGTGKRTEVYTLGIQLFPVSRRQSNVDDSTH